MGSAANQDKAKLEAYGFEVALADDLVSASFPFVGSDIANTPEQRARQIINYAQDPEITAIWAVHGGESSPEVAKLLTEYGRNPAQYIAKHAIDPLSGEALEYSAGAEKGFPGDRALPKIVGMSDVSSVQLALAQFGLPSLYANCTLSAGELLEKAGAAIAKEDSVSRFDGVTAINSSAAATPIISGPAYASVGGGLYSSLHTAWQPKFLPNTILMVEDVSGGVDLAKKLREAQDCGALENVQALVVGNFVGAGKAAKEDDKKAIADFAAHCGLPIFAIPDDQFGHLNGKEPTPIANFGTITMDAAAKTAVVSQETCHEVARAFQALASTKTALSTNKAASSVEFTDLSDATIHAPLRLRALNESATAADLRTVTDIVGGAAKKLPARTDLAGKTLLIADENWVTLGRDLTDRYNKGDLSGVAAIIVATADPYHETKARLDSAETEVDQVAASLSFITHPAFKYEAQGGRYVCKAPFLKLEGEALKKWAEGSVTHWLAASGINLAKGDIVAEGSSFSFAIADENNAALIATAKSPEREGRVRQAEKRVEYFAKRYMDFHSGATNQAGDELAQAVPVFMTDIKKLPTQMLETTFAAASLPVEIIGADKTFAAMVSKREASDDGRA